MEKEEILPSSNININMARDDQIALDEFFRNSITLLLVGYIISLLIYIGELFIMLKKMER